MKKFLLALLSTFAVAAHAQTFDWTAPPYPAPTTLSGVIVTNAGSNPTTKRLAVEVNGVWYRGLTEFTVIGIPSAYHKVFQSSETVLQSETGGHLTVTVEMVGIRSGSGVYTTWTYTIVSGTGAF